nr:retrovirus-related Pol polyprotein from transposon TNT 1-94 [Tanacetum cinerariifolium]
MSSDTKLTKDEEYEPIDNTKYRGMIGTTHLGLWYPQRTSIESVLYADSDHARDYVDRKSTSGICTFVGCCLTFWFSKKQTDLAISLSKANTEKTLRFGSCVLVPAFWFLRFVSCDLVLRFGPAFCLKTSCVFPKDELRFAVKHIVICFKARCVLLQSSLHFALRHAAFCFKTSCVLFQDPYVLSQDSCVLSHGGTAFCLLLKTLSAIWFTSQVITAIADRIRGCLSSFRQELLEYIDVHDNDASESSQPSWGRCVHPGLS